MGQPFVGEIRIFAGNFPPAGWAMCDGQLLPISENEVLFQLIGTTYGGDGQETFALPNLRGRVPMHAGQGPGLSSRTLGESGGSEQVTLTMNQLPAHGHTPQASATGTASSPAGNYWAGASDFAAFAPGSANNASMHATAIAPTGGSQPHDNMLPFLTATFIISLFGVFPPET